MNVLITPTIDNIETFDARYEQDLRFYVPVGGGMSKHNLVIQRIDDNEIVYDSVQIGTSLTHKVPPSSLQNGVNYKVKVAIGDSNGYWSDYSTPVFFWTYSKPVVTITNIDYNNQNRVYTQNPMFLGTYKQAEGNLIESYKYLLYDSNKVLIKSFDERFTSNPNKLNEEVAGLESNQKYYIEATTTSVNGDIGSSGQIPITPYYEKPLSGGIVSAHMVKEEGAIQISVDMSSAPSNTDKIRIQRREENDWSWEDIIDLPYDNSQNMFKFLDKYIANNEGYIYCAIPVVDGVSSKRELSSLVRADFRGVFISDLYSNYALFYDLEYGEIDNNIGSGVFVPLSARYPIVVSSGLDYGTFSVTALFVASKTIKDGFNIVDNIQNERKARKNIMRFLKNGNPKVYRDDRGELKLVSVMDNIKEAPHISNLGLSTITINLIEIGSMDTKTLISNNLREGIERGY